MFSFLLYSQVFLFDYALYFRDIYHNYYPFLSFISRSLQQGELPFWNPYVYAGTPQLATLEPAIFYPPGWIFFLGLSYPHALGLNLILHHLLAACGIYLLGRSFGWHWFTRTLCACLFSFSGVMVSLNNFHPLQNTVAWLPLVFWAGHELLSQPRRQALLVFAAVYCLQILSGHLEIVYFESLLLLAYGLFLFRHLPRPRWRVLALMLAAVLLGVALSAIQLLPAISYLPDSVRQSGLGTVISQLWSFHPFLTPLLLMPDQAGTVFQGASLNMIFGEASFGFSPFFLSIYLGALAWMLFFAGLTLLGRLGGRFGFFSGVLGLCLLLAYGKFLPLYQGLLALPGAGFFRYPAKLLVFAAFALALAAGCVLDQVLREPALARRLSVAGAALAGLALLLWLGLQFSPEPGLQLIQSSIAALRPDISPENGLRWSANFIEVFKRQVLFFLLLNLLYGGLWLFYLRRGPGLALGILLLAVNFDLLANGINTIWVSDRSLFETPSPVAAYLHELKLDMNPQERMTVANEHQSLPVSFEPEKLELINFRPNLYQHEAMVNNFSLLYGFRNLYGLMPNHSFASNHLYILYQQGLAAGQENFRQAYESLNSVRYLLTINPEPAVEAQYQSNPAYRLLKYFPDTNVTIWENLNWLPRARFQYQAMAVGNRELMVTAMAQPKATGFDMRHHVLLLDDAQLARARQLVPAQAAKQKHWSEPTFLSERNNRVEIGFETNTSGYLVLADQNLPGWQAQDNGRETPILRANYFQRAVRVGPGQHRIVFSYEAPGFRAGWISTLGAALLWLGLLLWRRQPDQPEPGSIHEEPQEKALA
ncbi:MAG: YfhO family protein [Candidatus Sericytochromatia bacterium]